MNWLPWLLTANNTLTIPKSKPLISSHGNHLAAYLLKGEAKGWDAPV